MRRTGKTTLLIDEAIQELFTKGEVYIPNSQQALKLVYSKDGRRGKTSEKFSQMVKFIDHDFCKEHHDVQDFFADRFRARLFTEHSTRYFVDNSTHYKLSDEYYTDRVDENGVDFLIGFNKKRRCGYSRVHP